MFQPQLVDDLPADINSTVRPGRRRWEAIADALRAHKGQWMIVAEDEYTSAASKINLGGYPVFTPAGAFEARVYGTYPGTTPKGGKATKCERIYARYVGHDDEPTPTPAAPAPTLPAPEKIARIVKVLPPFKRAASALAQHHAEEAGIDWSALPIEQRGLRAETAHVALQAVYSLVGEEMTKTLATAA